MQVLKWQHENGKPKLWFSYIFYWFWDLHIIDTLSGYNYCRTYDMEIIRIFVYILFFTCYHMVTLVINGYILPSFRNLTVNEILDILNESDDEDIYIEPPDTRELTDADSADSEDENTHVPIGRLEIC